MKIDFENCNMERNACATVSAKANIVDPYEAAPAGS